MELSNVSKACKIMGYSRQQFYEFRHNFQLYGAQGLLDKLPGAKGPPPPTGWVPRSKRQLWMKYPTQDPLHVAQELILQGVQVCSGVYAACGAGIGY